jgi:hypothetical protein
MKILITGLVAFLSSSAFAVCPNLSGTYVGDLNEDVITIAQVDCESLEISYAPDIFTPSTSRKYLADDMAHPTDAEFQKSSWDHDRFVTQLFQDAETQKPAGPKQMYSLDSTASATWLKLTVSMDGSTDEVLLYQKQH